MLNSFSTKSPPFQVTLDNISLPPERLEIDQASAQQLVRGRGGVLAVMHETHWTGFISPSWEHERNLNHHGLYILRYWSGTPSQHRQAKYRQMRIGAAHSELSWPWGDICLAPAYNLVPRTLWLRRISSSPLHTEAHLCYKARKAPIVCRPVCYLCVAASKDGCKCYNRTGVCACVDGTTAAVQQRRTK